MKLFLNLRRAATAAIFALGLTLAVSYASAQEGGADQPSVGFQAAEGESGEGASKGVIGAYAAFLFGTFAYLIVVVRKQTAISKSISDIAARIDSK